MKSRVQVLHIIKTLRLGGAEVNLLNLLQAMDRAKFEPHVAYSFGGELEEKFQTANIKLCKYAQKDHRVRSLASALIVARLVSYILKNRIDIIHTHTFSAHIWGSVAAKLTGRKIVEHVHDFRYVHPDDLQRRRGANRQFRYIQNFRQVSDRVVVLTQQNREFLIEQGLYPSQRILKYHNGISLLNGKKPLGDVKSRLIAQLGLRPDALVILTPIRLAPEKNIDLILRIAPKVISEVPNAVFVIAGEGPLYEQTLAEIQRLGLQENVRMIGYYPDTRYLLKGTDIFLLPSFLELHSIALLEALSMAVAVVISRNTGCHDEFIDGENGVLLDPFQDEGWAQTLIALLRDPQRRAEMARKGHDTCLKKFDINEVARSFEELYDELALA